MHYATLTMGVKNKTIETEKLRTCRVRIEKTEDLWTEKN